MLLIQAPRSGVDDGRLTYIRVYTMYLLRPYLSQKLGTVFAIAIPDSVWPRYHESAGCVCVSRTRSYSVCSNKAQPALVTTSDSQEG
jgi:hypothetical protein